MNTTVVFYSRTGHTRLIAECVADVLDARLISIAVKKNRFRGAFSAYVAGGMQAMLGMGASFDPSAPIPDDSDLLIVGTPVWSSTVTPPVRSFLAGIRHDCRIAVFCTCGVSSGRCLDTMRMIVRQPAEVVDAHSFRFAPGYSETNLTELARDWATSLHQQLTRKEMRV